MRKPLQTIVILGASLLSVGVFSLQAQTEDSKPRPEGDRPPGGRPVPPLIKALDANGDMEISADEIANASKALQSLDKNGDGKLTRDELFPPRPDGERPPGPRDGDRGPRRGHGDGDTKRPPVENN